jgi:hypothetical protein
MISVLLLVFGALMPGDTELLKYRMPEVSASALDVTVGQYSHLGTSYYGKGIRYWLIPRYDALVIGERMNLKLNGSLDLEAPPIYFIASDPAASGARSYDYELVPNLVSSVDWYPFVFPLGLEGAIGARSIPHWVRVAPDTVTRSYDAWGDAGVGPCFGRLRDAQSVIQALRILDLLKQNQQVQRPADHDDVQSLTDLLAIKPSYSLHFHQPEKNWFGDFETLLRYRGLIRDQIPARTWFLLREAVETANSIPRPVGVRLSIRPGLGADWTYRYFSAAGSGTSASGLKMTPELTLNLASGYPLSRRWQFADSATWRISADSPSVRHELVEQVSIDYHVFDLLIVSATYSVVYASHFITNPHARRLDRWQTWQHGPTALVKYYQEDRLSLDASVGYGWSGFRTKSASGPATRQAAFNWNLSFSCRLLP